MSAQKLQVSIEQGLASNYLITISVTPEQYEHFKEQALLEFAKTFKKDGFREGKVPLAMVKKEVNEIYLEMDALNGIVNQSINIVLDEHKNIKFIGQPYDLDKKQDGDNQVFTYKLDVYPEAQVLNDNWKSLSVSKVNDEVSEEELDEAIKGLRHQYATYIDADAVSHHSVDRVKAIYSDADGVEVWTKTLFVDHSDKHDGGFHNLEGKKVGDVIQLPYNDSVPAKLKYGKEGTIPTTLTLEVLKTQSEQLPEFTDEKIQEMFGNEGIKTLADLRSRVGEVIKAQKYQGELIQHVDQFVIAALPSFKIQVPKLMIDAEFENRYKGMTERFGGKEKFESAYLSLPNGKEELQKKKDELVEISKNAIIKFLALQKITELLDIKDVAWDKDMDIEMKLYEHFNK